MRTKRPVKKIVVVEVETYMNNNDLKNLYKRSLDVNTTVTQVQVNLVKSEGK